MGRLAAGRAGASPRVHRCYLCRERCWQHSRPVTARRGPLRAEKPGPPRQGRLPARCPRLHDLPQIAPRQPPFGQPDRTAANWNRASRPHTRSRPVGVMPGGRDTAAGFLAASDAALDQSPRAEVAEGSKPAGNSQHWRSSPARSAPAVAALSNRQRKPFSENDSKLACMQAMRYLPNISPKRNAPRKCMALDSIILMSENPAVGPLIVGA